MATTITAGNATNGAAISSDNTGILELKTGTGAGTTAMTIGTDQSVTFAAGTTINGITVGRGGGSVATNTAVGASALVANTTGANNTAVGNNTLDANTTANGNTAIGNNALGTNITGGNNVAVGNASGFLNTAGTNSTYVGDTSGYNTTGSSNTFIGSDAGYLITSGTKNTILGRYTGNTGGLDIRTASNRIVLSDGDGNPRMNCTPNSDWEITPGESGSSTGVYPGIYASYGAGLSGAAGEASLVNNLYFASGSYRFLKSNGFKGGVVAISASGAITGRAATNTSSAGAAATTVDLFAVSAGGTFALQGSAGSVSGTGITFPATQSASSNANTLDDYEEGTWTPTLVSTGATFTYTTQFGSYVKVGQMVLAQLYVLATASGTTSNACSLSGLPFASSNTDASFAQYGGGFWSTQTAVSAPLVNSNGVTTATLWKNGQTATQTAANMSGTYLVGTFMYRSNA